MVCTTVLHGGVCHLTSTPHKSGNKMKEKKKRRCVIIIYAQSVMKFLSPPVCSPRSSSTSSCICFLPLLLEVWPHADGRVCLETCLNQRNLNSGKNSTEVRGRAMGVEEDTAEEIRGRRNENATMDVRSYEAGQDQI